MKGRPAFEPPAANPRAQQRLFRHALASHSPMSIRTDIVATSPFLTPFVQRPRLTAAAARECYCVEQAWEDSRRIGSGMTTFHLVRHGAHEQQGKVLVGRSDVPLSGPGLEQSKRLADRLAHEPINAVLTSPRERTRRTAEVIAERHNIHVETAAELDEVDFGDWLGRAFADLRNEPEWDRYHRFRSIAAPPGGESLLALRVRVRDLMLRLEIRRPEGAFVLVSHGDVIRAAVLHCLGLGDDAVHRIDVAPGSLTTVVIDGGGPRIICLNERMWSPSEMP
jgi:broad specificity phosphatase PhoE